MGLTFLTGGARSGKSTLAVAMGRAWDGPVVYVATGWAGDAEMAARIERHRAERPPEWALVEEPVDLDGVLLAAAPTACVIVDCLTLWVANLLGAAGNAPDAQADEAIAAQASVTAAVAAARAAPTVVVGNEVGSGLVPMEPAGRRYRDLLGRVNATFSLAAERAALVVAGRPLWLAEP